MGAVAGLLLLIAELGGAPVTAAGPAATAGGDTGAAGAARRDPADCTNGLRDVTTFVHGRLHDVISTGDGRALAVGFETTGRENDRSMGILTAVRAGATWRFERSRAPQGNTAAALHAVARGPGGEVHAAGVRWDAGIKEHALVMRRVHGRWVDESPAAPRGTIATGVDIDAQGRIWVTGTQIRGAGARPIIWSRRPGRPWRRERLPAVRGGWLADIAAGPGPVVAVGTQVLGRTVRPLILTRVGGRWVREAGPAGTILSSVAERAGNVRAGGWSLAPGPIRPQLLERNGRSWSERTIDGRQGATGFILALTAAPSGLLAGGASYVADTEAYVPGFVGGGDMTWAVAPTAGYAVVGLAGDPSADGWMVAETPAKSPWKPGTMLARTCGTVALSRSTVTGLRAQVSRVTPAPEEAASRFGPWPDGGSGAADEPAAVGGPRDVRARLGLPSRSRSYGTAGVGDIDGDGTLDLAWSRHGGGLGVFLGSGGRYVIHTEAGYLGIDRHPCIVARLDPGPTADIACLSGANHGYGIPQDELYLDATAGAVRETGAEHGLSDPSSRGRVLEAFDADGDGDTDLYVGTEPRRDGIPSVNRLLLNDGTGHFGSALGSGLTSTYSVGCADAADVDRDGDADLVVCQNAKTETGPGIHLYENLGHGRFVDRTRARGVRTMGESDALLADVGGDRHLDLVQVGAGRVRVSVWAGGRYHQRLDRRVRGAEQAAAADADGDGDVDLYIARGLRDSDPPDLWLRNDGRGRWTTFAVPGSSGHPGVPTGVLAADLDGDGRPEYLALAGADFVGPVVVTGVPQAAGAATPR
ncbi:MAG: VCBS repeat-containing protein [Chloroflexota bacterium]